MVCIVPDPVKRVYPDPQDALVEIDSFFNIGTAASLLLQLLFPPVFHYAYVEFFLFVG